MVEVEAIYFLEVVGVIYWSVGGFNFLFFLGLGVYTEWGFDRIGEYVLLEGSFFVIK